MKILILINVAANHGRGLKKWLKIRSEVSERFENDDLDELQYTPPFDFQECFSKKSYDRIIIAGGDGSFHYAINQWLASDHNDKQSPSFGAIGLGSSNDLHKPFRETINGVAVRIGDEIQSQDIGSVTIKKTATKAITRHFVINASFGITAYGNQLFNKPDIFLKFLKPKFTELAINYAALKAILCYRNQEIIAKNSLGEKNINMSSINIIKSPHISGGLKFDQDINPTDGHLGLHICEDMNKMELISTFIDLMKGQFSGKKNRHSSFEKEIHFQTKKDIALELDGEIYTGSEFIFSLLPKHLKIII